MTNCPICTGDAHPAMAARYGGCCSDSCWEIQDARAERDQARADGLLILEHLERQQSYEQLLRQVIASLIEAIPGEGPCGGLPCDGLTAPCAICCAHAVLG